MDIGGLLHTARLPTLAPVVLKLYEVLDSGGACEIAKVIESDTALSARLLRLANSAFYTQSPVTTVRDAVVRVGALDVAALLLTTEVLNCFHGMPEDQFNLRAFWGHSLRAACYSRVLSQSQKIHCATPLWLCGLLHDVGKLLFLRQAPAEYAIVLANVEAGLSLLEAETEQIGFTHAEAGEQLFGVWNLPEVIATCVGRHHEPYTALTSPETIVAVANDLANEKIDSDVLSTLVDGDVEQVMVDSGLLYQSYRQLFSEYLQ